MKSSQNILRCDESGLCEEVDGIARDYEYSNRLVARGPDWFALVDIAPLTDGHLLVCPSLHVHSTLDIQEPTRFWLSLHELGQRIVSATSAFESYILVEHGTRPGYCGPSCVKHVHVHLVLSRVNPNLGMVLERLCSEPRSFTNAEAALQYADGIESYVLCSGGTDSWIVARPSPEVRQVSRAIVALSHQADEGMVDWAITAGGAAHREAVSAFKALQEGHALDIGKPANPDLRTSGETHAHTR